MKIGIFDSGLGGLAILKALQVQLPQYEYVFLGDTKHVPYGDRAQQEIYRLTKKAVSFLFAKNCQIVILACNTASAKALRKLQQQWLPKNYPNRRILGMVVPTVESVVTKKNIRTLGLIATKATVESNVYKIELAKINPKIRLIQLSAPKLVPLIEAGAMGEAERLMSGYVEKLTKVPVDGIILACTHYSIFKNLVKRIVGRKVVVISQDEVVPGKLRQYVSKHKEIKTQLGLTRTVSFYVTKTNPQITTHIKLLFGKRSIARKALY